MKFRLPSIVSFILVLTCMSSLAPAKDPAKPERRIQLFNGKDLKGFDTFLQAHGLNQDPNGVFRVESGVIRVSGSEYGYLITQREFENYSLRLEFKWGEKTYPPREGKARDSGILFHVTGPDRIWPRSIEFQIIEGGTGDIILVGGTGITVGSETKTEGRFDRFGKGPWRDVVGYRDPAKELEKPRGEWNVLDMLVAGDRVQYLVNGRVANIGVGATVRRGKILLQSEGAEIFFRNIELRLLEKKSP